MEHAWKFDIASVCYPYAFSTIVRVACVIEQFAGASWRRAFEARPPPHAEKAFAGDVQQLHGVLSVLFSGQSGKVFLRAVFLFPAFFGSFWWALDYPLLVDVGQSLSHSFSRNK